MTKCFNFLITARIRRMGEGNVFSVFTPAEGVPHPDQGWYPPGQGGVPPDKGRYPPGQGRYTLAKVGTPSQGRYPQPNQVPPPSQGRYTPAKVGTPQGVATWQAVCLLHSRRTFLFRFI